MDNKCIRDWEGERERENSVCVCVRVRERKGGNCCNSLHCTHICLSRACVCVFTKSVFVTASVFYKMCVCAFVNVCVCLWVYTKKRVCMCFRAKLTTPVCGGNI